LGESLDVVDDQFRKHLVQAVDAGAQGVRLGDLCTISRGEELGDKACRPLSEVSSLVPILRGRDLSMLGPVQARVGISVSLSKAEAIYESPKIMVVKTGAVPTVALDLTQGVATLQSIYNVHLRSDAPDGIALPLIAWLLASPDGKAQFRQFTAGKTLFPQLNQHMLAAFELPSIPILQAMSVALSKTCPLYLATGVLHDSECEAIARILP
jgi:hypothetical protein